MSRIEAERDRLRDDVRDLERMYRGACETLASIRAAVRGEPAETEFPPGYAEQWRHLEEVQWKLQDLARLSAPAVSSSAPTAAALAELARMWWAQHEQLAKVDPAAAERLVLAMVSHLRSIRPECIAAITIGPPTERIVDPRTTP